MKILIATNMYPTVDTPYFGLFVRLQEESLRRLGLGVEVAAHGARASRWAYLRGLGDLTSRLRHNRYDLIHSHHSYSTILAVTARRLAGRRVPIVMTFHESEIYQRGRYRREHPLRRLRYSRALKAWALRRADMVIQVQRDMLRTVLGEAGAARVPSTVMPMGIDLARFTPGDKLEARRRLGWEADAFYVFFPCDPRKPEKRYDLARGGFDLFARGRSGARLVVSGKIPDAEMVDTIRAADVILLPTDFEASPSAVKEALACERPVVSTDVGDVQELYGDLPGLLPCDWTAEDVAEKIRRAAEVPIPFGGRRRLIEQKLDLEDVARRLIPVYEETIGRFKGGE